LAGQHNARNALAAAAGALALGCTPAAIAAGLAAFTAVGGRGTRHRLGSATLIDESYNANPDSVAAAIALLGAEAAPRLLVLGDMGEVGVRGPQFHREAGELAQRSGIGTLYTVGAAAALAAEAFGAGARHHPDAAAVAAAVGQWLAACPAGSTPTVLVKGSRFMRLESVVERLGLADSRVTGAAGREGAHA
jgi:UDP-N-acetylmuramoyl-tripeptide--D-alanyl-D-alanine ligase